MFPGSFITAWLVNTSEEQQESLKDVQDGRITVASEFLRSVRVVKYFGWEDMVVDLLKESRSVEQHHLWKIDLLLTAVSEAAYCIPVIALLVMFSLYVFVLGQPLTASVAYTAISLLELIRDDFTAMSMTGFYLSKVRISLPRLD
ncbi:hypothetical protein J3459_010246 [Metarhizium acridum]|uniref:uncharacterized protein n=1 Tax=Metarhizium acridum TaxID=92637 RepID=UPI001C6B6891|nr:hypothetical protein J3459_010246 [Metarhizium acridum]KAG8425176.1 hypothetical protein J3458_001905 [Metarhizium acridum]